MRNWIVFIIIAALILISFLIWGEDMAAFFNERNTIDRLSNYGAWAWLAGIALLIADLFLPLPATIIMSALGYLYGPLWGGLLAALGNFLSGMVAYWLCRAIGDPAVKWLLGEKDFQKGKQLYDQRGGWIVAVSRWLPILPETIACMAGLNRMNFRKFTLAVLSGALPLGFVFAYIGYSGLTHPVEAVVISAVLPALLWGAAQFFLRKFLSGKQAVNILKKS